MATIVKFNRKFTQAQLTAAVGASSIAGTAVHDGTWYIAKTGAQALYVGSIESGSTATLKLVAQINANTLTGKEITNLINAYIANPSPDPTATLITKVDSAVKDENGLNISSGYLKVDGSNYMTGPLIITSEYYGSGLEISPEHMAIEGNNIINWTSDASQIEIGDSSTPNVRVRINSDESGHIYAWYSGYDHKVITSIPDETLTATEQANVRSKIGAMSSSDVDNKINALDATVDKDASSSAAAIATTSDLTNASQAAQVVATGYTIVETDGKLVSASSSIDSGRADKWGAAAAALAQAKSYTDEAISGLEGALKYKGTVDTTHPLPSSGVEVGDLYVVAAKGTYAGVACEPGDMIICQIANPITWNVINGENQVENKGADITAKPSNGTGQATTIATVDGTDITLDIHHQHPNGASAGTAGTSSDTSGLTIDVPYLTTDIDGHVTAKGTHTHSIPAADGTSSTGTAGYMTAAQAKKLEGIAAGAEVNQNAFSNVTVGATTIAASSKTDTLILAAGSNVTLTPNSKTVTIAAKDTTYRSGPGIDIDPVEDNTISVAFGESTYEEAEATQDAWKRSIIQSTLNYDIDYNMLIIANKQQNIPAATPSVDGYMTSVQATNLVTMMSALTWEE